MKLILKHWTKLTFWLDGAELMKEGDAVTEWLMREGEEELKREEGAVALKRSSGNSANTSEPSPYKYSFITPLKL